jgi:hypothetical protein
MLLSRIMIAAALSLAMVVSLAPGNPRERASARQVTRQCCKTHSNSGPQKGKCDGGPCAMACCRVIPVPPDSAAKMTLGAGVVEIVDCAPPVFHSLIDPEAIFHPPRV